MFMTRRGFMAISAAMAATSALKIPAGEALSAAQTQTVLDNIGRLMVCSGRKPKSLALPVPPEAVLVDMPADPRELGIADRTGTATWFRVFNSRGRPVFDGSIGMMDDPAADMIMNTPCISAGAVVKVANLEVVGSV